MKYSCLTTVIVLGLCLSGRALELRETLQCYEQYTLFGDPSLELAVLDGESEASRVRVTRELSARCLPSNGLFAVTLDLQVTNPLPNALILKERLPSGWIVTNAMWNGVKMTPSYASGEYKWLFGIGTPVACGKLVYQSYANAPDGVWSITGSVLYESVTVSTVGASDLTVCAMPIITNTCTVIFDAAGGDVEPLQATVASYLPYGELPFPVKTGCAFGGWWTQTGGSGELVTSNTVVMATTNHTLYAFWTAKVIRVTLDAAGGAVSPVWINATYGATYGALPVPTRFGYTFSGWWAETGGTGTQVLSFTRVTSEDDLTLYAKWEAVPNQAPELTAWSPLGDPAAMNEGRSCSFRITASDGTDPEPATRGMSNVVWYVDNVQVFETRTGAPNPITSAYSLKTTPNTVTGVASRDVLVRVVAADKKGGVSQRVWKVRVNNVAAAQKVAFPALPVKALGEADFALGASSSSGLAVAYSNSNPAVIEIDGGVAHIVGTGTAVITASQPGDFDYRPAASVRQTLTVKARVTAEVPSGGGTVTGAGLYAPGAKVTLTAKPLKGCTFLRWEDGSQAASRKFAMPDANVSVAALFKATAEVSPPVLANPGPVDAMVGVRWEMPLGVDSECQPKVTAKGLPPGVKFDAQAVLFAGVPSKAGAYDVTIAASNPGGAAAPQTFSITVAPLKARAQGVFTGLAAEAGGEVRGLVGATISEKGVVSAKVVSQAGTVSFKGASWDSASGGVFRTTLRASKGETLTLEQDSEAAWNSAGLSGTLSGGAFTAGVTEVRGQRNPAAAKSAADYVDGTNALARFKGFYTVALTPEAELDAPGAIGNAPLGSGYLALTVKDGGTVTLTGKLADGTVLSGSSALMIFAEEGAEVAYVPFLFPLYGAKECFSGVLEILPSVLAPTNNVILTGGCFALDWRYPGKVPSAKPPQTKDCFTVSLGASTGPALLSAGIAPVYNASSSNNVYSVTNPAAVTLASASKTVTVIFDEQGGKAPKPPTKSVTYQSAYGDLAITMRTGYTFEGWWTGMNGEGVRVNAATIVTIAADHTLYANWDARTFMVTFDAQGGKASYPGTKSVQYGSAYGTLATTTRTGYTFGGWYTEANGGGELIDAETTVNETADHTLYAKWTANQYTVRFDAQGGTVTPPSTTVTFGSTYGALPLPTAPAAVRVGSTFGGWFTGAGGTGSQLTSETVATTASDHTLYAKWVRNDYLSDPKSDSELASPGSYDGYFHRDFAVVTGTVTAVRGTFSLRVTSLTGKLTAKAVLQKGSLSFSATAWSSVEDGTFHTLMTTRAGERLDLYVRENRLWGTLEAAGEILALDGARNHFSNTKDAAAQALLNTFKGYYTLQLPVSAAVSAGWVGAAPQGTGYLTLTVGSGGSAKIAGVLADGTAVSQASRLIDFGDAGGWGCVPFFLPLYGKKGWIGGLLWIDPARGVVCADSDMGWFVRWEKPGAGPDGFSELLDPQGCFYSQSPALVAYYRFEAEPVGVSYFAEEAYLDLVWDSLYKGIGVTASGSRMTMAKGTAPVKTSDGEGGYRYDYSGANSAMATLAFTAKTGVFRGSFKGYCDYPDGSGRLQHKSLSVPYAGVMVPEGRGATLLRGNGYCLVPDNDPEVKTFKVKRSFPVRLLAE